MRVIAGIWGGRLLVAPKGTGTRPTADRVREAIFSSISARAPHALGGPALDAFAGSGALGLEAISRGAPAATFVERDRAALDALRANVSTLEARTATVAPGDVMKLAASDRLPGGPFSLILLDPPYRIDWAQVRGLLEALAISGAITADGVVVYEHDSHTEPDWPAGFGKGPRRDYGDTAVSFAVFTEGD